MDTPSVPSALTVARLQVVLDVSVEVTTQAAGPAHELRAEFDVDGAAAPLPGQREAALLRHQHVLRDLLQLQVMDVMRQLQAKHTRIRGFQRIHRDIAAVVSSVKTEGKQC